MMRRSNFLKSSSKKSKDIGIGSLALGLLFSGILLYFGFWIFGRWQANQAIQDKTDVKERIELEFKVQSHLLEVVKAFGNLTFAVTAYYAWRNLKVAEENRELAENRQVTERFSKAVEMLGSEEKEGSIKNWFRYPNSSYLNFQPHSLTAAKTRGDAYQFRKNQSSRGYPSSRQSQ